MFFINKQITKQFLEETFGPANNKSLRLRSAAFEMHLSHGFGVHDSNVPLLSELKQFLVY